MQGNPMANRIERDSGRYREIVKGQVRKELKKFISHSELLGKKGKRAKVERLTPLRQPSVRSEVRNEKEARLFRKSRASFEERTRDRVLTLSAFRTRSGGWTSIQVTWGLLSGTRMWARVISRHLPGAIFLSSPRTWTRRTIRSILRSRRWGAFITG